MASVHGRGGTTGNGGGHANGNGNGSLLHNDEHKNSDGKYGAVAHDGFVRLQDDEGDLFTTLAGDQPATDLSDDGSEGPGISPRALIWLCAISSSLTSVLLGYDVGVMSGAILYIKSTLHLSTVQQEVIVGSLNLIAAFGGLVAGKAADAFGRKKAIALACFIFMLGATIMTISRSFELLLFGRVVTGIGVGCGFVIAPVYITELAPPDVRGKLVSLTDICINFGILLGYFTSYVCQLTIVNDDIKWRAMVGIGMAPPVVILTCLTCMPESPRWLISQGHIREGYRVLCSVVNDEAEARETLQAISRAVDSQGEDEAGWMDVLWPSDGVLRAAAFVGLGLGFWQQATGSEAAVYYTPTVLMEAGMGSPNKLLLGTMAVGFCKLLGEVIAAFLLDRIGRRPLFMASSISCTVCLVLISLSFALSWPAAPMLISLCLFMFCFSIGIGPLTFVVAAEIFPLHVRGKAVSLVVFINRFLSGVIALSFLSLTRALTSGGAFGLFAAISFCSIWFYYFCVPETKGKTLEEITTMLASEFHLATPDWARAYSGSISIQNFPGNERLVSVLSSQKLVATVSGDRLLLLAHDNENGVGIPSRSRSNSASLIY